MKEKQVKFIKYNDDLRATGEYEGKEFLSYGILQGEEAVVDIIKKKKGKRYVKPIIIVEQSQFRIVTREEHYLCCSPLQCMDYNYQIDLKNQVLSDLYDFCGNSVNKFHKAANIFNYRNKLEFSFYGTLDGIVTLAFHRRDSKFGKEILPNGCELGSQNMNFIALEIVKVINKLKISAKSLKTLTIRESKSNSNVIATLLIKDELDDLMLNQLNADLVNIKGLNGLICAYSSPKSPVSLIDKVLFQFGDDYLEEDINGLKIRYSHDSFFQNNIPVFELALKSIINNIDQVNNIVELYSGVGTIGLNLVHKAKEVFGVELIENAVNYSKVNAELNKIDNYSAIKLESENIDQNILDKCDILVLDPPRAGLHPKLIKLILDSKPNKIIYLSCNPITQARDIKLLMNNSEYRISNLEGFDFYPNTPHMESLVILEIK
jgi:23S rRNA (uracil1939-C5)-methyltransferase